MNRKRKRQAGACSTCGRPVPMPGASELAAALDRTSFRPDVSVSGHHYIDGRLDEVACMDHEPDWGWD